MNITNGTISSPRVMLTVKMKVIENVEIEKPELMSSHDYCELDLVETKYSMDNGIMHMIRVWKLRDLGKKHGE